MPDRLRVLLVTEDDPLYVIRFFEVFFREYPADAIEVCGITIDRPFHEPAWKTLRRMVGLSESSATARRASPSLLGGFHPPGPWLRIRFLGVPDRGPRPIRSPHRGGCRKADPGVETWLLRSVYFLPATGEARSSLGRGGLLPDPALFPLAGRSAPHPRNGGAVHVQHPPLGNRPGTAAGRWLGCGGSLPPLCEPGTV